MTSVFHGGGNGLIRGLRLAQDHVTLVSGRNSEQDRWPSSEVFALPQAEFYTSLSLSAARQLGPTGMEELPEVRVNKKRTEDVQEATRPTERNDRLLCPGRGRRALGKECLPGGLWSLIWKILISQKEAPTLEEPVPVLAWH